MPDPPLNSKRPRLIDVPKVPARTGPRYAELHAKTNFSFLEGASHPDELVSHAAKVGCAALAVTDRNSLAGMVRAHAAAKQVGLKLIVGAEIEPCDAPPVLLWTTDRASYGRLARLITRGRRQAPKGEFQLTFDELAGFATGLMAGVLGRAVSEEGHCWTSQQWHTKNLTQEHGSTSKSWHPVTLARYRELFGDRCYLVGELSKGPDDQAALARLVQLAARSRLPLVAAGDVHHHLRTRLPLQDTLTAIRHGVSVAEAGDWLFPNGERYLKSPAEMAQRFAAAPQALARTLEIAHRSTFSLDELRYEYPEELAPAGQTPLEYLTALTWAGAAGRYPAGVPDKVRSLLEHELALIADLRYEAYFLTVYDLVRFARERSILCQGRGSAANSAVCYCLGVTAVDPGRLEVLFERFFSRERNEAPDIDIDFEHERREEVLQYLYDKYGRERAGMTAEVITYRPRSAVRDVGKALGLSLDRVNALAKSLEGHHEANLPVRCREAGIDPDSPLGARLLHLVGELVGFPRHLGQHVGGMVMTQGPLCELVPIENAAMDGRTVIEWDKDDLDELGILKVDCLALGMLTAIRKCFDLIHQHTGRALSLATVPDEDPAVYEMMGRADTMGVFQIESRAQMSMLPRLKPQKFYDLVIEVAIVRPGPIQGNMVHPYLRRRAGEESITYPSEAIRDVLTRTLGVPLFQEQAMQLAVVAAGFTPGEADGLRRAMGAWRRPGIIEQFRQKLLDGMEQRGLTREFAQNVFQQISGFGEYGFPESHAASFALLVYVSAWLKHYYPAAFTCALLNSQPMGFYAPSQLVRNARDHGVPVRPAEVNASRWECTLEDVSPEAVSPEARNSEAENSESGATAGLSSSAVLRETLPGEPSSLALRLGLQFASGLAERQARAIEQARGDRPFAGWEDFMRRTRLNKAVVARLASADAFASLRLDRRGALWRALAEESHARALPLFEQSETPDEAPVPLPELGLQEEVLADYRSSGLSLKAHPLEFFRPRLQELQIVPANGLPTHPKDRHVRVAGIVLVRQRPGTAKGITFVTLEDETGTINLIIRQDIWQQFYRVARTATAYLAQGRLQRHGGVIHVLVSRLEDLSEMLRGVGSQSRDFH